MMNSVFLYVFMNDKVLVMFCSLDGGHLQWFAIHANEMRFGRRWSGVHKYIAGMDSKKAALNINVPFTLL